MSPLKNVSEHLLSCLSPETLQRISAESGLIKRKRVFTMHHLLWLCVWQKETLGDCSLTDMCYSIQQQFGIKITPEGLNQRFNKKSVAFLKIVLSELLEKQLPKLTTISHHYSSKFNRIRILDSTSFQISNTFKTTYPGTGGSGTQASAKIQLEYDLSSGTIMNLGVGPGKIHDANYLNEASACIEPKDLCIRDLGYFKLEDLALWHSKGAYFLSRLKVRSTIYTRVSTRKKGKYKYYLVDLSKFLSSLKRGDSTELSEVFMGRSKSFPARLIIYRLTEDQLNRRRKKQKLTEKMIGTPYSDKTKILSEFNLFITNVPSKDLSIPAVCAFYSLRWQIELLFKSWKSYFLIHHTKGSKLERFECQLYGKLISILVSTSLLFQMRSYLYKKKKKEISELKSSRIIASFMEKVGIYTSISVNRVKLNKLIREIFTTIQWLGIKCQRYDKPTALEILQTTFN